MHGVMRNCWVVRTSYRLYSVHSIIMFALSHAERVVFFLVCGVFWWIADKIRREIACTIGVCVLREKFSATLFGILFVPTHYGQKEQRSC